ncbi:MAG: ATP-binding cassette domain-containing protein [Syntrophobacteraceae bacterium]|jgi:ABC-2 type transport system ATP-binding protein|nr:ATP-binding cassette domain-containing protein [Syntrophobacteraceae bacterium]
MPKASRAENPVARIRGLLKGYGGQQAVRGVDLEIAPEEIHGLIGPDGAGKTSLLKAMAGVLTFDAGSLQVFGIEIDSDRAAERIKDRIGFMPQGLGQNLYPELSIEENIDFFAQSRLVPRSIAAERREKLLGMTRLDRFRDRPMKNLSGGMKQKLGLICTLIHDPRLVILDEPTTGVDPISRRDFWAILSQLLGEGGTTAVVSTAYMDEASRFHSLSLLFDGKIVAQGTPDEISALAPGTVVSFEARRQAEAMESLRKLSPEVSVRGSRLRVFVGRAGEEESAQWVREALGPLEETAALRTARPELEDVFIALLREKRLLGEAPSPLVAMPAPDPGPREKGEPRTGRAAIEARSLVRDFGTFRAVDGVSFQVAGGEIFGLLGANGAGKTTVIKMLVGLVKPSAGSGHVAGQEMLHASREIRCRIGYMSQVFSLYGDLTVAENIGLYAGIYGLDRSKARGRAGWILEMAGLTGLEDHRTSALPVGLRQRLALGCALVHRPRILFLDEPTSGVDPVGRRRFWDILFHLSRHEGVAILITTHAMSEAEHCDRLALMHAGKLVADASPGVLKRQLESEMGRILEVTTDRPIEALDLLRAAGFEEAALHGRGIHLPALDLRAAEVRVRKALDGSGVSVLGMGEQPVTMEDVFVYRVSALERAGRRTP